MIKGINKQIIEIKCTNDEYFDKVLLFVRADRSGTPDGVLKKSADNFCGRILPERTPSGSRRIRLLMLAASIAALCGLLIYLIAVI